MNMETIVPLCPSCKRSGIFIHGKDTITGKCFTCWKRKIWTIDNIEKYLSDIEKEIIRWIHDMLWAQFYDIICSVSRHWVTFKKRPGARWWLPSQFRWIKEWFWLIAIQEILGEEITDLSIVYPLSAVYKLIVAWYNGEFTLNEGKKVRTNTKKYQKWLDKTITQIIMSFIKSECTILRSTARQMDMDEHDFAKLEELEGNWIDAMLVNYVRENSTLDFNTIYPILSYAIVLWYHEKTAGVPVVKKKILNIPDGYTICHSPS